MPRVPIGVVYWLRDDSSTCIERHGYVGVTVDWPHRLYRHRSESDFLPDRFEGEVIFKGTIKKCLELEQKLRPAPGIGWNKLPGGLGGYAGKGIPKSPEHREKIRQAALRRYADPKARERLSRDVKRGLKHVDRSGANNHRFGVKLTEATKEKIRQRALERDMSGASNPNYRHGRYTET